MTSPALRRPSLPSALAALALLLPLHLQAQPPEPQKPQAGDERTQDLTPFSQGLFLHTQPDLIQKHEAAQDYITARKWEKAVAVLQSLLDAPEDVFVPFKRKDGEGKEHYYWNSQRAEADRMLGILPPEGLQFYQLTFGNQARQLLAEARRDKDVEKLAAVAQRFLHTSAGAEAAAMLGSYHLDRGRALSAALCYQRLLGRSTSDKLSPKILFQAALACERCGDQAGRDQAWQRLVDAISGAVELGGKRATLDDLRQELQKTAKVRLATATAAESLVYRGRPDRQGLGSAGTPVLQPRWRSELEPDPLTRAWLEATVNQHGVRNQPVLPALFPIAAHGKTFARTTRGVAAWDLAGGKLLWESESPLSLDALASEPDSAGHVDRWMNVYLTNHPHLILENSVVGSLSSDGRFVFAVEDVPLPPYPGNYSGFLGKSGLGMELQHDRPQLTDAIYHSRLVAIAADSGKVVWERGGRTPPAKAAERDPAAEDPTPLHDCFLMGPPLPLGDKIYLLAEKDQSLRLLCLDPEKGDVLWTQRLALNKSRMVLEGGRRLHAAHLAYGEGVLICPTNAGGLIALDLLSHSLLWAYAYREEPPPQPLEPDFGGRRWRRPVSVSTPPNLSPEWRNTAPIIADGKVIFTAPDAAGVFCLSLRDGRLLWKADQTSGEQYLAGVRAGKILVVGTPDCRLLSLADGKPLATIATGVPSGQGVFAGSRYLLPVKSSATAKEAGVCVIDLERETIYDFIVVPEGEAPGNLLAHEDTLLSQTVSGVTAYPLKTTKEDGR